MTKEKLKLVDVKYIDMYHFQMWEGKFLDEEQEEREIYIYANLSNFETETYDESELRVYAHSFEDLYCPEYYELPFIPYEAERYMREEIRKHITNRGE